MVLQVLYGPKPITFHRMTDQECQAVLAISFIILITGTPEWRPGKGRLVDRPEEQNQIQVKDYSMF